MRVNVKVEAVERGERFNPGQYSGARAFKRLGGLTRALMRTLLVCLLAPTAVALAQSNPPRAAPSSAPSTQGNPLSTHNKFGYMMMKTILLRSAEKMPEESYSFKPTEAVRSYGQIVGHVADSQYMFCSIVLGEKNPAPRVEKTKTSKAELIAALKDAFAYCDRAYDGMTDASATQTVKLMGMDAPKLFALMGNNMHTAQHYGNLITYMRMKNIVPPTSEPGFLPRN
ncbi:MAG TPA: DinB family protein [Pyrinomonadaceae bacterium]